MRREGHAQILDATWPNAPSESIIRSSALMGMLLHRAAVSPEGLKDPWALGPWCSPVLASVGFLEPVVQVKGKENVWSLSAEDHARAVVQIVGATYREFDAETDEDEQAIASIQQELSTSTS